MKRATLAVFLAGCFSETHRPTCEYDPEPIADDVEVGGVTGADLLAAVEGTRTEAGTWDDGTPIDVSIDVSRTGSAEYVHTTRGSHVTRHFGFGGGGYLMMYVPCGDFVRVPLDLRVSTEDDALDVAVETFVRGPMTAEPASTDPELEPLTVDGDVPLRRATVPDGSDDVPAEYEKTYAFARVTFPPDEGPTTGSAGWGGEQETEEYSKAAAFYVLEW